MCLLTEICYAHLLQRWITEGVKQTWTPEQVCMATTGPAPADLAVR